MKITKKQLQQLVNEAVRKKLDITLKESNDFTAKRRIVYSAQNVSMEFEEEIKTILNLRNPDELDQRIQEQYFQVVEKMKNNIVKAVSEATKELVKFPRNDEGGEGNGSQK